MRVLVIGGTVFIGRAIVGELVENGHDVCVVHRGEHEPDDLLSCRHIHVDRAELADARSEIEDFCPEAVVDNVAGSAADADTALAALGDGPRLYVISSMDVYLAYGALHADAMREPVPIDETSPVREERYPYRGQGNPRLDDYEKIEVEERYLAHGATALRLPMVYGPHDYQRREELILRRVRAGRERIPVGSGTWLGTKGFVGDLARGIRLAVESDAARGQIFNLGESRTYPMGLWVRMILEAAGSGAELVRVPDDQLPPDLAMTGAIPQHLLVDSSKARRVLGWTDTDARQALSVTVRWHLDNPPSPGAEDFSADDRALKAAE